MTNLSDIKALREKTGASLQACKKALDETNGDEAAAIEILRKKGEAKMAKRSDRETTEGTIVGLVGEGKAILVKFACETDFVAKNPDFVKEATRIAQMILDNGKDHDVTAEMNDLNLKMGEKIELAQTEYYEGDRFGHYVHSNGKIGALVQLDGGENAMANDVAMHITAMSPLVISPDEVDENIVVKEREIWTEQLAKEGKPAEIMEKILMGKERKFREENALNKQAFVKNPDQTIEEYLGKAHVTRFARMAC